MPLQRQPKYTSLEIKVKADGTVDGRSVNHVAKQILDMFWEQEKFNQAIEDQINTAGTIAHEVLSPVHTDSTEATVQAGDLIRGKTTSGTTTWQRFAISSAKYALQVNTAADDVTWDAVVLIKESGGQELDIGAINDGEILRRSSTNVVGVGENAFGMRVMHWAEDSSGITAITTSAAWRAYAPGTFPGLIDVPDTIIPGAFVDLSAMDHILLIEAERTSGTGTFQVRLSDSTNSNVIATTTGAAFATRSFASTTTFSNLPSGNAMVMAEVSTSDTSQFTLYGISWFAIPT